MNYRKIPVLASALALAASIWQFTPSFSQADRAPDEYAAPVAELPEPPQFPWTEGEAALRLFMAREATGGQLAEAELPRLLRVEICDSTYRLCAYAGSPLLWIASVEDSAGRYHTMRQSECIPGTTLEFRGIDMRSASGGIPDAVAIFIDRQAGRGVEIGTRRNDAQRGPVCVISTIAGEPLRLGVGGAFELGSRRWTLQNITDSPAIVSLVNEEGQRIELRPEALSSAAF